jgi:hypothetical protein
MAYLNDYASAYQVSTAARILDILLEMHFKNKIKR